MYQYKATLARVVDGDTVDLDIDLGFRLTTRQRCRFAGVNAPETKGPTRVAGLAATAFVQDWFTKNTTLRVQAKKPYADDKYGRFLVEIFGHSDISVNAALLSSGHAVPFMTVT